MTGAHKYQSGATPLHSVALVRKSCSMYAPYIWKIKQDAAQNEISFKAPRHSIWKGLWSTTASNKFAMPSAQVTVSGFKECTSHS